LLLRLSKNGTPASEHNISPRWLSLRQAVAYCPLGRKRLIEMVQNRVIKGGQHSGTKAWFFDRYSIDVYFNSKCINRDLENKVVEFLKRVK